VFIFTNNYKIIQNNTSTYLVNTKNIVHYDFEAMCTLKKCEKL